jgi:tRNA(fMet)-specific endonuclease VapC
MENLRAHPTAVAIASPVWHELHYGRERLSRSRKRRLIESYLRDVVAATIPIIPYDAGAAAWHATERARLSRRGRPPPFVDGQIAAIAAVNGLTLVTGSLSHYRRFSGLRLADWRS